METFSAKTADLHSLRIDRKKPFKKKSKRPNFWLVMVLLLCGGGVSYWQWKHKSVGVEAATALSAYDNKTGNSLLSASGYIVAQSKAEISSKIVGRIEWINLEEGKPVKKGELLARLESYDLQAQLHQAEANLKNATLKLRRIQALEKRSFASQQALENAEAELQMLQAQKEFIQAQLKDTEIHSPIEGVITVKRAHLGETVAPQGFGAGGAGATIATVVDLHSLEMEADISEQNIGKIKVGQAAEIILDAYPNQSYRGELRQIIPTADRQKGAIQVKVAFLEKDALILPEMSGQVTFFDKPLENRAQKHSQIIVPASAVITLGEKKIVYVIENDKAFLREVKLAEIQENYAYISEHLKAGEKIVLHPPKAWLKKPKAAYLIRET